MILGGLVKKQKLKEPTGHQNQSVLIQKRSGTFGKSSSVPIQSSQISILSLLIASFISPPNKSSMTTWAD